MNELGIVFGISALFKRYYLLKKSYNQDDNLLITEKLDWNWGWFKKYDALLLGLFVF